MAASGSSMTRRLRTFHDGMPEEKKGDMPGPATDKTQDNEDGPAQSPQDILNAGIEALNHPDVHPAIATMVAPILIGAKHFGGPHPAIDAAYKSGRHPDIGGSGDKDPMPSIDGNPDGGQE